MRFLKDNAGLYSGFVFASVVAQQWQVTAVLLGGAGVLTMGVWAKKRFW